MPSNSRKFKYGDKVRMRANTFIEVGLSPYNKIATICGWSHAFGGAFNGYIIRFDDAIIDGNGILFDSMDVMEGHLELVTNTELFIKDSSKKE